MTQPTHIYCWVRKDLSMAQQIVQAAHATHEAGIYFGKQGNPISALVLLQVSNEKQLKEVQGHLEAIQMPHVGFIEPDMDNQLTSICTRPVEGHERLYFANQILWDDVPDVTMSKITQIKYIRECTKHPLLSCKRAYEIHNGDVKAAIASLCMRLPTTV